MFIRQEGATVTVWAPAKLNLFLEVIARRRDGYHEVVTLVVRVRLYDTLKLTPRSDGSMTVNCRGVAGAAGGEDLPQGADNLAGRALELLRQYVDGNFGAHIELTKRIPPQSGLGGGSSDAAAALLAANAAWKLGLPREALAEIAGQLGSDVPLFLTRETGRWSTLAVCSGRGEQVAEVSAPAGLSFVIVRPAQGLSTAEVYRQVKVPPSPCDVRSLLENLQNGDFHAAAKQMSNRLQGPAQRMSSEIGTLQQRFEKLSPLAHQLSGSGSAYFGWFANARCARSAAGRLRGCGYSHVWQVQSI